MTVIAPTLKQAGDRALELGMTGVPRIAIWRRGRWVIRF